MLVNAAWSPRVTGKQASKQVNAVCEAEWLHTNGAKDARAVFAGVLSEYLGLIVAGSKYR